MNDGVKILLERMETHPEEFIGDAGFAYSKWGSLISAYKEHLTPEDRIALDNELCKLHQQRFTEKVLEELVDPKKSDNWVDSIMQTKGINLATQTPMPSISNISVTPSPEQTLARLREIKKEYEPKPHKTIFGKLFNYT